LSPVALVSGASRGIGAEIARELAADHGFQVFAGVRDPSKVVGAPAAEGDQAPIHVRLDVTDQSTIDAARETIESGPGKLDALVNNAGIHGGHYGDRFEDSDIEEIRRVMETNTFGAWRLTQAMLPLLRRSDHPRVVNVSSGAGQLTEMNGGIHPYRMSKTGMSVLTRTLANDGEVIVNSMCPGWVRTDMGGSGAPRSVEEGADTAVWLATLPDDGPNGGFFRDRKPIPW
jgi:NAD(P)-dependent dehydrogenase (short-subunit alcohol dehydrogenase family)